MISWKGAKTDVLRIGKRLDRCVKRALLMAPGSLNSGTWGHASSDPEKVCRKVFHLLSPFDMPSTSGKLMQQTYCPTQRRPHIRRRSICVVADDVAAREAWRECVSARRTLGHAGREALRATLDADYKVIPRKCASFKEFTGNDFPVLHISPSEVRH